MSTGQDKGNRSGQEPNSLGEILQGVLLALTGHPPESKDPATNIGVILQNRKAFERRLARCDVRYSDLARARQILDEHGSNYKDNSLTRQDIRIIEHLESKLQSRDLYTCRTCSAPSIPGDTCCQRCIDLTSINQRRTAR